MIYTKDTLFHRQHSEFSNQILDLLFNGWNVKEFDFSLLRDVPDEMMPNFYVLCLRMLNEILSDKDGTCIVIADGSLSEFETVVKKLVLNP